jgi:hypothetical protein
MAKTVRRKHSVEFVAEYSRWELHKRWAIGFVMGALTHWLIWGG